MKLRKQFFLIKSTLPVQVAMLANILCFRHRCMHRSPRQFNPSFSMALCCTRRPATTLRVTALMAERMILVPDLHDGSGLGLGRKFLHGFRCR